MAEMLAKFDGGEIIGLIAVIGTFLCGALGICLGFCYQWQESRRAEITAGLKQDMLSRGMTAEEIQIVLDAGVKNSSRTVGAQRTCRV